MSDQDIAPERDNEDMVKQAAELCAEIDEQQEEETPSSLIGPELQPPAGPPIGQQEEAPKPCEHCGKVPGKMLKPDEKEMKEYVRRLLSGQSYTKAYELFDGALTLTFRTLTQEQRDYMEELMQTAQDDYLKNLNEDQIAELQQIPPTLQAQQLQIRMVFCTERIGEGDQLSVPEKTAKTIKKKQVTEILDLFHQRFVMNRSADLLPLIVRTFDQFTLLTNLLMGAAFDTNFYKGVGLD
jgi:hypothetical protein